MSADSHSYNSRETYYSNTGTGRLRIELAGYGGGREGRGYRWSDNTRTRLEDKLPDVLREVEIRAAEDEHRRQERLAAEALRRPREEEAARQAAIDRIEKHRADTLLEQVTRWENANRIRTYLGALRGAINDQAGQEDGPDHRLAGARKWAAWAERYIETLDPLSRLPGMSEPPR